MKLCTIEGCGKPYSCKGYCNKHYLRFRKYGDPLQTAFRTPEEKASTICALEECDLPERTGGYCNRHYLRLNRYGDPRLVKQVPTVEERFWEKVDKNGENGCWVWTAGKFKTGYGSFNNGESTPAYAHRYSFQLHGGVLVKGLHIDHKCHVRDCVNPEHLRQVTTRQNVENHSGPTVASKTGIRGVCWDKGAGKYLAQLSRTENGKRRNVLFKHFEDIYEAEKAVINARNTFHTHNDRDRQTQDKEC